MPFGADGMYLRHTHASLCFLLMHNQILCLFCELTACRKTYSFNTLVHGHELPMLHAFHPKRVSFMDHDN